MSEEIKITDLLLIKTDDSRDRYIVETDAFYYAMENGSTLSTLRISGDFVDFCYIKLKGTVYIAPIKFRMLNNDYTDYLDAVKIKSVRHRDNWINEPDADTILTDAEKRLHIYSRSYPGFINFIRLSGSYDGSWNPISVPEPQEFPEPQEQPFTEPS